MPKVLLVEDDNNLREIFEMRLQAEGYQTVTAGNGEEGLTMAMQQKPDLIICDVMMPKLSGFEMLETLRTAPEGKDVKVIMMTALGQAEDRARGEQLGVVKYLVKSQATLEDFAKVVQEVLPSGAGNQTNQGGESPMQEDPTTNPSGDAPTDNPMPTSPADPMMPPASNPSADTGAMGDQQTTSQEQSAVDAQVNDFVANAPSADSAAPADNMTPSAPMSDSNSVMPTANDSPTTNPVMSAPGDSTMPADTSTDAPAVPPATPPADTPPVTPPQTDAPAGPPPSTI